MSCRNAGMPALAAVLIAALGAPVATAEGTGPTHEQVRVAVEHAEKLAEAGDPPAETAFRDAVEAARRLGRGLWLPRSLDGLAAALQDEGRWDDAALYYAEAITRWEKLLGPDQPRVALSLHNLGVVLLKADRPRDATPRLRRALEIWTSSLGAESVEAARSRRALEVSERSAGGD